MDETISGVIKFSLKITSKNGNEKETDTIFERNLFVNLEMDRDDKQKHLEKNLASIKTRKGKEENYFNEILPDEEDDEKILTCLDVNVGDKIFLYTDPKNIHILTCYYVVKTDITLAEIPSETFGCLRRKLGKKYSFEILEKRNIFGYLVENNKFTYYKQKLRYNDGDCFNNWYNKLAKILIVIFVIISILLTITVFAGGLDKKSEILNFNCMDVYWFLLSITFSLIGYIFSCKINSPKLSFVSMDLKINSANISEENKENDAKMQEVINEEIEINRRDQ